MDDLPSRDFCSSPENEAIDSGHVVRLPITDMFCESSAGLCDQLLLRATSRVHSAAPLLLPALFGDFGVGSIPWSLVPSLPSRSSIAHNPRLMFTPGEPACNVYTKGGQFKPHEDGQSITMLVVLSDAAAYEGGGTGFWSEADRPFVARLRSVLQGGSLSTFLGGATKSEPTHVIRPPAGSALVFGGNVTHAGVSVAAGERTVVVASFSNRNS